MKALTWQQFRDIMNLVDKSHSMKPSLDTNRKGVYTANGKGIKYVVPQIDMGDNQVFSIVFYYGSDTRIRKTFSVEDLDNKEYKHDNLFDNIMEWINTKNEEELKRELESSTDIKI